MISELYDEHCILTFYGSNREIPLIISPSIIVSDDEIDIFLNDREIWKYENFESKIFHIPGHTSGHI